MNKKNKKIFKLILLIVGCAIFFVLIYKVGPSTIYHQLIVLKWKVLLLLLPFSLVFVLDTLGWKYAFTNSKISFKDLFLIRIAGESLNWIIPSANFAGEPMKAYFLKKHNVPMAEGMASVVISKTILIISQIIFVMIGVAFLLFELNISGSRMISSMAIILLGIPIIMFIVFAQRQGLFAFLLKEREEKLLELDKNIYQFYRHNKKKAFYSFVYCFLGYIAGLIEAFMILYFLNVPVDTVSIYII